MQRQADEVDLREYIEVVRRRWKRILQITVGAGVLMLVLSLLQSPVYEAKTTVLVRSDKQGSFSKMADIAGLAGIALPSGSGNVSDLIEVLQSKAVAERVVEDLDLSRRIKGWEKQNLSQDKKNSMVQGMLHKPQIKGNLVELTVGYSDPRLAAEIANSFVEALSYFWNKLNYTEARKKKEYIESQLPRIEKDLKAAEQRLKNYTLLSPKMGATSKNLFGGASGPVGGGVEVTRLAREVAVQSSVYTMLRKEYESVKLEEAKEIPPFSLVDKAVVPEHRSKPRIRFNIMVGLVIGLLVGVFTAFFQEYWNKSNSRQTLPMTG